MAELFAAYDTVGIEYKICEILNISRRNFPDPEQLYRWMREFGYDFCDMCQGRFAGYDCSVCPIEAIKHEQEGDK